MNKYKLKKTILPFAAVFFAILLWQLLSVFVHSEILIPSPVSVLKTAGLLLKDRTFLTTVFYSSARITAGFLLALAFGTVLAGCAGRFPVTEILFRPFLSTVKSVPVASFIVISLIWLTTGKLSVFISFLMALPIIYTNILQGIHNTDRSLSDCAAIFGFTPWKKFLLVQLPAIKPFLFSACSAGIGLAWKAGVAAEVIGIPVGSIGERLYDAKIHLNSTELFAWTIYIVLLSIGLEKLFLLLLKGIFYLTEKKFETF